MTSGNPFSLAGTVALITGASSGIGAHFAHTLAAAGAKLAIAARRLDRLETLAAELRKAGADVAPVAMDVTDAASVEAGFAAAEQALGTVTLLINNSGVATGDKAIDLSEADWDSTLDTNLKGAWLCSRAFAKRLIAADRPGVIINNASILGLRVAGGVAAYAASKAGLIQLTQALALELARHRIRVNALAPGYIATDLNRDFAASDSGQAMIKRIPQRRLGNLEDLDGPLLLLASDASRYMTGTVIAVDGGHLVSSL